MQERQPNYFLFSEKITTLSLIFISLYIQIKVMDQEIKVFLGHVVVRKKEWGAEKKVPHDSIKVNLLKIISCSKITSFMKLELIYM